MTCDTIWLGCEIARSILMLGKELVEEGEVAEILGEETLITSVSKMYLEVKNYLISPKDQIKACMRRNGSSTRNQYRKVHPTTSMTIEVMSITGRGEVVVDSEVDSGDVGEVSVVTIVVVIVEGTVVVVKEDGAMVLAMTGSEASVAIEAATGAERMTDWAVNGNMINSMRWNSPGQTTHPAPRNFAAHATRPTQHGHQRAALKATHLLAATYTATLLADVQR